MEEEREEWITVNFKSENGGTYQGGNLEGIDCPNCKRPLIQHSKEEVRECSSRARKP
jgi:hypothetical protein